MLARPKTYDDLMALETGTEFTMRLPQSMSWRDRHAVFYRTANREVMVTLFNGEVVKGTLVETPGYFSQGTKSGPRMWLRVPGRKTRKPVNILLVRHLRGFKAPSLEEAFNALVYLTASNPSDEQVAEARATVAQM